MNRFYLLFSIFLVFTSISFSQDKTYYNPETLDLGEGKILGSSYIESTDFVSQEFKVEVPNAGMYYIAAWLIGGIDKDGDMLEYLISVNGDKEYVFKGKKSGPQAVNITEKKFDLRAGINTITIKSEKPYCPDVEFVKVSLNEQKCLISEEGYDKYIDGITKLKLPDNYAALKKAALEAKQSDLELKSYELSNPAGNYDHLMDVDFSYSFSTFVYLEQGHVYTFETKNATSDPVLHVFNQAVPAVYTLTDDDSGSGYNAKITFTAPFSANYRVFVRKNGNPLSVDGTCDIYFTGQIGGSYYNDVLFYYNAAVSGTEVSCPKTVTETLNWFTADVTGDSRIWILNNYTNANVIAENDDWTATSGFTWGNASRIRTNLNTTISGLVVTSNSYYQTGNCDLYMNCMNSNLSSYFPKLSALDAIQSAPVSTNYNCISWSGGRVDLGSSFWPGYDLNPWCAHDYDGAGTYTRDLFSFNNFYANRDYQGNALPRDTGLVMNFYNNGENPTDAVVALWGFDSISLSFEHASVKKPGNNHPHGYDWESKPGGWMRTFHPRDSLEGSGYGKILYYYRWDGTYTTGTPPTKSASLSTDVELSVDKQDLLKSMVSANPERSKFDELYKLWKNTWRTPELMLHSNPRRFSKSDEYKTLLEYCKNAGKTSWPLVFEKYISDDELNMLLIMDLTKGEYLWLIDEIMQNQHLKSANIHPIAMQNANYIYYISVILEQFQNVEKNSLGINENVLNYKIYPNPVKDMLNIELAGYQQTEIRVNICDLTGKIFKSVIMNNVENDVISIETNNLPVGNYICKVITNGETTSQIFNITK